MTKDTENMVIYQSDTGAISLRPDTSQETIWATQKQMAQLFDVNVRTVNDHIKTILKSNELDESVIRVFRITANYGMDYYQLLGNS